MELFYTEGGIVKPTIEVLLINPYKEIWERDFSDHHSRAIQEFSYIKFMIDPRKTNPYYGYSCNNKQGKSERERKVIENIFADEDYDPDELVVIGMDQYNEFFHNASPTLSFLESAREGAEKLKNFFRDFDLNKTNDKGALLYKPADITRALKDTQDVIKSLAAIQEKVYQEVYEAAKTTGNREINEFERR